MTDAADDLEALFEEVASQRSQPVADTAPAAAESAEVTATAPQEPVAEAALPESDGEIPHDLSGKPMYERLGGIV